MMVPSMVVRRGVLNPNNVFELDLENPISSASRLPNLAADCSNPNAARVPLGDKSLSNIPLAAAKVSDGALHADGVSSLHNGMNANKGITNGGVDDMDECVQHGSLDYIRKQLVDVSPTQIVTSIEGMQCHANDSCAGIPANAKGGGNSTWASIVAGSPSGTMNLTYVQPPPPSLDGKITIRSPVSIAHKG